MGTEISSVDCGQTSADLSITRPPVNQEVSEEESPPPSPWQPNTPPSNWKKRLWSSLRRTNSRKTKSVDSDEEQGPTSLEIRRAHLQQLAEARPQLTDRQMTLIEDTWSIVQRDISTVGLDMFSRMFEAFPGIKESFGPLSSMVPEDHRYRKEISEHGVRVLNTVDTILRLRHDPDKTIETLHDLGGKHISFNAKVDYIDLLGQHFLFAMEPVLKQHWTPEVEQAWADLFRLMSHVMKEGMVL
ncbi:hypothetical protein CAPTEDRAFT_188542 [Capitella teleta]|uniref:Globin domain-containing protein n=1 Tax=Capitella teleta TaxID=283909 RepID=R7URJ5_CAPTE|nr:hypothetical protein CAPTEDRAFT_188542 [Capitella teleta]|eukprot:ELU06021.1 hypothetical protein CAPTEDRAFT_188542 [Capitella teleta]